jgi:hypothetical protein
MEAAKGAAVVVAVSSDVVGLAGVETCAPLGNDDVVEVGDKDGAVATVVEDVMSVLVVVVVVAVVVVS